MLSLTPIPSYTVFVPKGTLCYQFLGNVSVFILIISASSSSLSPTPSAQMGTQQPHCPAPHFYQCPVCSGLVPCQHIWFCSILFNGCIVLSSELQSHAFMWFILRLLSSGVCDDTGQVSAQCHFSITPPSSCWLMGQEIMNLLRAGTPISIAVSPTMAMFWIADTKITAQGWHPTSVSSAEVSNKYSARINVLSISEKLVYYGQTLNTWKAAEVCTNTPLFGVHLHGVFVFQNFLIASFRKEFGSCWKITMGSHQRVKSQL